MLRRINRHSIIHGNRYHRFEGGYHRFSDRYHRFSNVYHRFSGSYHRFGPVYHRFVIFQWKKQSKERAFHVTTDSDEFTTDSSFFSGINYSPERYFALSPVRRWLPPILGPLSPVLERLSPILRQLSPIRTSLSPIRHFSVEEVI
ncbi:hypothetical protein QT711_06445 [Sporosarcina saromensis]|uniref:Uncharacterized protein n=1 Tax=Sporosarcina saromensis TaxID=359365 RepID=A0ABU4G769_9BACL|nr:hypothetical protein [Sporosarcina saromensis]MDW0112818.1 hypothetical protein [Sporosarcina saromensis]